MPLYFSWSRKAEFKNQEQALARLQLLSASTNSSYQPY